MREEGGGRRRGRPEKRKKKKKGGKGEKEERSRPGIRGTQNPKGGPMGYEGGGKGERKKKEGSYHKKPMGSGRLHGRKEKKKGRGKKEKEKGGAGGLSFLGCMHAVAQERGKKGRGGRLFVTLLKS